MSPAQLARGLDTIADEIAPAASSAGDVATGAPVQLGTAVAALLHAVSERLRAQADPVRVAELEEVP